MSKTNIEIGIIKKYQSLGLNEEKLKLLIKQYNKYIVPLINKAHPEGINFTKIFSCHKHRQDMLKSGNRPPCYACKYVKRSMNILVDYMFIEKRNVLEEDRVVFLLRNTFKKNLRITRVNHLRLLASNIASMGNIEFSCANNLIFNFKIIKIIRYMLTNGSLEIKERYSKHILKLYGKKVDDKLSKIDKALLYYLVAFRYYSIAKLDKDASDCLLKILIVINNALTVNATSIVINNKIDNYKLKQKDSDSQLEVYYNMYETLKKLFDELFMRYAKLVNRQCGYSEYSEVQDIRKILHMHEDEDINFTRSHQYSELIEAIWHIIDSEIKLLDAIKSIAKKDNCITSIDKIRNTVIINAYNHFKYIGMPHNTFYNEVIYYFAKFNLNNYILKDILNGISKDKFEVHFLQNYRGYLTSEDSSPYDSLFNIRNSSDKQNLIEFIIEDSIICLSEILYKLTPFNHISSFSHNFVASIYDYLWEYAKMYETIGRLYDYKDYPNNYTFLFEYLKPDADSAKTKTLEIEIKDCLPFIRENTNLREKYGSLRNRMFTRLKHNIDDRTFKYTISYHAAEMALRYYSIIESSYSEGTSYRNQVSRNYLLNDDLDNDTWLFNTAIERFRFNTKYIEKRKRELVKKIDKSRFYKYNSYVMEQNHEINQFYIFDDVKFDDSLFTNTEL